MTAGDNSILLRALIGPGIVIAILGLVWLQARLEGLRSGDLLASALGWGLVAMMLAIAGGAVYPPIVAIVAQPFVCGSGIEIVSNSYSYKPGQQGVSRFLLCAGEDGAVRDVTIVSIVVATLVYTLAGLAFSRLRSLLRRLRG
ncbi:hypothetical protein ACFO8O_07870 [Hephaestia sp. GCM10023244]|uniref:hypothetical protein n=1 Tax=unclassified Hephaestia TaxID=2631281 RepID=UPI0020778EAF|nr:hypothetical protein [Hephaestia sp. MAHUQ-44]MCM8730885.1 hypothetical protein [Hephaestia sp. MAHUQ-44]